MEADHPDKLGVIFITRLSGLNRVIVFEPLEAVIGGGLGGLMKPVSMPRCYVPEPSWVTWWDVVR